MLQTLSGRWRFGFALALLTAVLWGAVPLAMTPLVADVDPVTIAWVRFLSAGSFLFAWFLAKRRLRFPRDGRGVTLALLGLAVLCLVGNFVFYVSSLRYISAPVAQIVVQLSPVLLMLGSLMVFRERFGAMQWGGFALLLVGIVAFCMERLRQSGASVQVFGHGVLLMVVAAVLWSVYGLAQKRLLLYLPSQFILMSIYLVGALLMLPAAHPRVLLALSPLQTFALGFLIMNTLVAYGAFAEALNHWESSKVGAVLALQPLTTLFGASLLGRWWPAHFPAMPISAFMLGACLTVVGGSMVCALGGERVGKSN